MTGIWEVGRLATLCVVGLLLAPTLAPANEVVAAGELLTAAAETEVVLSTAATEALPASAEVWAETEGTLLRQGGKVLATEGSAAVGGEVVVGGLGAFASAATGGAVLFFGADYLADRYNDYRLNTAPRVRAWLWEQVVGGDEVEREPAIAPPEDFVTVDAPGADPLPVEVVLPAAELTIGPVGDLPSGERAWTAWPATPTSLHPRIRDAIRQLELVAEREDDDFYVPEYERQGDPEGALILDEWLEIPTNLQPAVREELLRELNAVNQKLASDRFRFSNDRLDRLEAQLRNAQLEHGVDSEQAHVAERIMAEWMVEQSPLFLLPERNELLFLRSSREQIENVLRVIDGWTN